MNRDDVIRERLKEICEMVVEEYEGGGGWQSVAREAKKILESLKLKVQHCNRDNGLNRDDIIRMAREIIPNNAAFELNGLSEIERFAALVAAHEREACAKSCDAECVSHGGIGSRYGLVAGICADAIRKRGAA